MRAVLVLLLLAIAGCDAASTGGPEWTHVGAVATFDYAPGPDSLWVLGPGREPPFRRAPSTPRAVEMLVVAAEAGDHTDRRSGGATPVRPAHPPASSRRRGSRWRTSALTSQTTGSR